jgi:heme-degrading monooxygenase HmoA
METNRIDSLSVATSEAGKSTPAFVALSKFTVGNGMTEQVREAFQSRPHLVDDAPGFLRMEVISPFDNPDEIWLLTFWTDEPSFKAWHRSHLYHESHRAIPKGLKLVPQSAKIIFFEHICS